MRGIYRLEFGNLGLEGREHLHEVVNVALRQHFREQEDELLRRQTPLIEHLGSCPVVRLLAEHVVATLVLQMSVFLLIQLSKPVLDEHSREASCCIKHSRLDELFDLDLGRVLAQLDHDLLPGMMVRSR